MSLISYVIPSSTQTKETFHGLKRTTEGLLYYTKIDKDSTTSIDLSNGNPSDTQLPTSGAYVDEREEFVGVQYFSGDGATTTFTLSPSVIDGTRIKVFVNNIEQIYLRDWTYSSPTLTFVVRPGNNTTIAVGRLKKQYKNNTSDLYQQYIFEDGDATYFLDTGTGYFVKRENLAKGLTALVTNDFTTAESTTYSVNSTTWSV